MGLVVSKILDKKRKRDEEIELAKKPSLEKVLSTQFTILECQSKPGRSTKLYYLSKLDDPSKQLCCKAPMKSDDQMDHALLINEATKLERCQHPNVVKFIKLGRELQTPYLMMERVIGESLAEKIQRHNSNGFRQDHIAWLIYQIAGALEYVHSQGISHLDVKPSNIMVGQDDTVKLIDFGAAQYANEKPEIIEASLNYASPSFVKTGVGQPEDDVYSLAVIAYSLFTGEAPGRGCAVTRRGNKRPAQISKHVWSLLTSVTQAPRTHGFTPISFAQVLGQIDVKHMVSGAPIFTKLQNADLVLSRFKSSPMGFIERWKYLEITMIIAVLVLVATLVSRTFLFAPQPSSQDVLSSSQRDRNIINYSRDMSILMKDKPWIARENIAEYIRGMKTVSKGGSEYVGALFMRLQKQEKSRYLKYADWVDRQRTLAAETDAHLLIIKNRSQAIHEWLDKHNIKGDEQLDDLFLDLFTSVGSAMHKEQSASNLSLQPEQIVNAITANKLDLVNEYLDRSWEQSAAQSYYVSTELRDRSIELIQTKVRQLAAKQYYTRGLTILKNAKDVFVETDKFDDLEKQLSVDRGEYVLRRAVNSQQEFDVKSLQQAYEDIFQFSPLRAQEIKDELKADVENFLIRGRLGNRNRVSMRNIAMVLFPELTANG